jgi:predicted DNA-binding WGR domain protein
MKDDPMTALTLHRIDPAKDMARFYRLDVQPDLFGGWTFIREWGRIGRGGTVRTRRFESEDEARAACERQRQLKERRGYLTPDAHRVIARVSCKAKATALPCLYPHRTMSGIDRHVG